MRPNTSRFASVFAIVIAVVGSSCRNAPISTEDLSGTWELTEKSRDFLPDNSRKLKITLEFLPDGTFKAENLVTGFPWHFPTTGLPEGVPKELLEEKLTTSGHGTWTFAATDSSLISRVEEYFDGRKVDLVFFLPDSIPGLKWSGKFGFGNLHVEREGTKVTIWHWYGDPDSGERLQYAKIE